MNPTISPETPVFAVPEENLVPVSDHYARLANIPPSRMFLINKSLATYRQAHPDRPVYDASQGDGGASLPGVPVALYQRALELQLGHGSAYDMPYGCDAFRTAAVEQYWQPDPGFGISPANIIATAGGRDALVKAYQAMLALGHGRQGDVLVVSRVPWISYNWGPYGIGANVLWAPGSEVDGWAFSEDGLSECAHFAASSGRKIAGVVITSPDNPTGRVETPERQAALARAALKSGAAFVLFDWMYHWITDQQPIDLNAFLRLFDAEERQRLVFMDGITKSLGGSNVRNAHLIAPTPMAQWIIARASHAVIPSFFSQAVAMAAFEQGFSQAAQGITQPTNASRQELRIFLQQRGLRYILGQGYYAFIHVGEWLARKGWLDSEPLGQYLAEEHGVAIVPGAFFSPFGSEWIRFSYATPVERTRGALERLLHGLSQLSP